MTRPGRAVTAALVVLAAACGREAPMNAETAARERFIRGLTIREGVPDVWYVMSRADVVFEDGWSLGQMVDPSPGVPWTDVARVSGSIRARPIRWLGPAGHLRLRGASTDMRLQIWGAVNVTAVQTRPRVSVTFDGLEIWSEVVGPDGGFAIDQVIPATWLDGWSDAYVLLSSVSEPWREPGSLRVVRVEGVAWEPLP